MSGNYSDLFSRASSQAKKILKDGVLLETTEALSLQVSNNYDFARRIVQELALIFAGQIIKHLNVGQKDRAYSHAGLYAPPGLGKDFAWKLVATSGIFPADALRMKKLENVTEAALSGTANDNTIIPPPTVNEDIIFVGEYATLMRGSNAQPVSADMRAILESGEYSRRLAKIGQLKEAIMIHPDSNEAKYIKKQLEDYAKIGMTVDLDKSEISIKSTTSWVVASAKFGSEMTYGRSLLSMGDINRYRWRSYLPDRDERLKITSEIGSLPPTTPNVAEKNACREAWTLLIAGLRENPAEGLEVPRDEQSYYTRQRIWDDTQKILMDTLGNKLEDVYFEQLVNLRTRAEFTRLMYQHATLKQFERNQSHDFSQPYKFVINNVEDGEFAKQLWISEYATSMIDVMKDVLRQPGSNRSIRITLTAKGKTLVLEKLKEGPTKREELIKIMNKNGISPYLLDNEILKALRKEEKITRDSFGVYSLGTTGKQDQAMLDSSMPETENPK